MRFHCCRSCSTIYSIHCGWSSTCFFTTFSNHFGDSAKARNHSMTCRWRRSSAHWSASHTARKLQHQVKKLHRQNTEHRHLSAKSVTAHRLSGHVRFRAHRGAVSSSSCRREISFITTPIQTALTCSQRSESRSLRRQHRCILSCVLHLTVSHLDDAACDHLQN